jgi:hypothetical protein
VAEAEFDSIHSTSETDLGGRNPIESEHILLLNDVSPKLSKAAASSENPLFTGLSDAFNAWSTTRLQGLEQRLNHSTTELQQIREEFELEEDMDSEYESDEDEEEGFVAWNDHDDDDNDSDEEADDDSYGDY